MTTYPLSEPAKIFSTAEENAKPEILGQGSLAECAEVFAGLSPQERTSARIVMDEMDLRFGPPEIDELLRFLRDEAGGLTSLQISAIPDPDR